MNLMFRERIQMYQNIQYDQLYHEAEVLAAVDHFIQEVCLGSYDLYQLSRMTTTSCFRIMISKILHHSLIYEPYVSVRT